MHRAHSSASLLPRATISFLTVSVGIAVANIYYMQPLGELIARDLHASMAGVATAMTAAQVGYALGLILLVPLGDGHEIRSLIVTTAAATVIALLFVAFSDSILALTMSSLLLGFTSSVVQMIIPYAVSLATPERRGRVVGVVMAGLLTGIMLARTASGLLGEAFGWRAAYIVAAGAMVAIAAGLWLAVAVRRPTEPMPWATVMRSLVHVFMSEPALRRRALVGALGMAGFSAFWSTLSFHLGALGHSSAVAGLLGAIGVIGVAVAPIAGHFAVRHAPAWTNVAGLGVAALSFPVFLIGGDSLFAIGLGVVLLDAGVQASHLANQTVIFGLAPERRNRLNALYMVSYFVGGAIGTFAASVAWSAFGWPAVCALGAMLAIVGIVLVFREVV